jgi:hypothetical protein
MWLNTSRIVVVLGLATTLAALIQILIGANIIVLALALVCIACGLYGFSLFGVFNLGGWFCLVYMAGNVLIAFHAKTVLLQPVNSNLRAPLDAFGVQAICCAALLLALIIAYWIPVGRPLTPPITDLTTLKFVSTWCLIIGFGFHVVMMVLARAGDQDTSYGGLNVFEHLMYLGIVARTALVMLRSDGKRMLDPVLIVALGAAVLSGVLSTGKSETSLPVACFVATVLFFKGKLPRRYVVGLVIGVILFLATAPIILTFRYMGLRNMPLDREVSTLENMLPMLLDYRELALLAGKHARSKKSVPYDYYGNHEGQLILGRFSSIQQIDPVVDAVEEEGEMGAGILIDGIRYNLPKALDPDKPTTIGGLMIVKTLGIYTGGGGFPTVPLAAVVFAAYEWLGIVFIPLGLFTAYLLMLKKLSWDLRGNIFTIFILATQLSGIHSAEWRHYTGYLLRDIPLLTITYLLMQKVAGLLTRRQREFSPGFFSLLYMNPESRISDSDPTM